MFASRLLGVVSAVGSVTLVGVILAMPTLSSSVAPGVLRAIAFAAGASAVLGVLAMILHLYFTRALSDDEKAVWRRRFGLGNLFVVAWYLWAVPGSSRR
jgi:hypothetical protein